MFWKSFLVQTDACYMQIPRCRWVSLFRSTLDYMKGELNQHAFQKAVQEAWQAAGPDNRTREIFDYWLTGLFYYQESTISWFSHKRLRRLAYQCWKETLALLSSMPDSPVDLQPISFDEMYNEMRLMGFDQEFRSSQVAKQVMDFIKQYPELQMLRIAVRQERSVIFRQQHRALAEIQRVAFGTCFVVSAALITAFGKILYETFVENPLLRLAMQTNLSTRHEELMAIPYHDWAYFQEAFSLYSVLFVIWAFLLLIVLSIEWIATKNPLYLHSK